MPAHMKSMSTNNPNRVTKGVSTGGQYAAENKSEDSSVNLTTPPARDYEKISEAQAELLETKFQNTSYSRASESATAAVYLASEIRQKYPEAATARIFIPGDGTRYTIASISDTNGKVLAKEYEVDEEALEVLVNDDGAWTALASIETAGADPATEPYMDVENHHNGENQTATFRVDDALNYNHVEKSAVKRGEQTIKSYQALHADSDLDNETVARDMLTDMHRWARANDVDLHDVFDRADRYATDEEAEEKMVEGELNE